MTAMVLAVAGCTSAPDATPTSAVTSAPTVTASSTPASTGAAESGDLNTPGLSTSAPSTAPKPDNPVVPAPPLTAAELVSYGGVVKLSTSTSCTATLIDTGVDQAPAYVLTNGHCLGLDGMGANDIMVDADGQGEAAFFNVHGAKRLTVAVQRFEYGTMRGVDVGIIRLDSTLGALKRAGAVPLRIADKTPAAGTEVVNIASPTEGIEDANQVLRKGKCTVGQATDLIEYKWIWFDAPRIDCPGVLGGSSGSPLIADSQIVSIINTTNTGVPADRGSTCYLGKPCEIDGGAATFVPQSSYAVNIAGIGSCFAAGTFRLGGRCPLRTTALTGIDGGGIFGADSKDGTGRRAQITLEAGGPSQVKVAENVSLGDARSCLNPAAYTKAAELRRSSDTTIYDLTLPRRGGFTLACVAVPGKEQAADLFIYSIDTVAPDVGPHLGIVPLGDDELMVDPLFDIPDIANIHLLFGPAKTTDCADRSEYVPYRRQPLFFEAADLPVRFCAIGFDMAGNESPVTDQIVRREG